jgi:OmpA-OmpF porin, OOP family
MRRGQSFVFDSLRTPTSTNERPVNVTERYGRASIDPDSAGLLDRLIETALRCPTANIEVAGHTDSDGEDAANQALSEKRAQAVADYLVKAGLPANRFTAVGYGSAQPIASNDTEDGKAQNRRIEFTVK